MDLSSDIAAWLSFAATAIGLGGLISQANAINDKMDPFHANRTVEYLGIWFRRQRQFPWWTLAKSPPIGPVINANLSEGFCGLHTVELTRVPHGRQAMAGWSTLLSIVHVPTGASGDVRVVGNDGSAAKAGDVGFIEKANSAPHRGSVTFYGQTTHKFTVDGSEWDFVDTRPLEKYGAHACTTIGRASLITLLVLVNARPAFQYAEAAGYRANFASYGGQWYINWPIGQEAVVRFLPHDSHNAKTDVYPPMFVQRVHCCINMVAGIVTGASGFKVAFCGRKGSGVYRLEHVSKGFPGAHGSRHLYNMMGGKVYEVDFMYARKASQEDTQSDEMLSLELPAKDYGGLKASMLVPAKEQETIRCALDCLPWTSLSWSIHRGLKDILLAYARPFMNAYRRELADRLKQAAKDHANLLEFRGWNGAFVRDSMGDMAASAVLAGSGDSGDLVRVVTDVVIVLVNDWKLSQLDEVDFWRKKPSKDNYKLDLIGIVALTKVFVLEWSVDFDYQMYHHLPISLYFA